MVLLFLFIKNNDVHITLYEHNLHNFYLNITIFNPFYYLKIVHLNTDNI